VTALEIRLVAYAVLALGLLGSAAYVGHWLTARHYESLIAADRASQDKALQDAQKLVIEVQEAQQEAVQAAEKKYADLKINYAALSDNLARSVQPYSQIHSGLVSATASTAAVADAARASTQRTSELAELVRQTVVACSSDSAELTALQVWANSLSR